MLTLIDWLKQFFLIFLTLWPIWLALLGLLIVGKKTGNTFLVRLSTQLIIVFGSVVLLLRILFFVIFPYGDVNGTFTYSPKEDAPKLIVIDYSSGQLYLKYAPEKNFVNTGKDLKGLKHFSYRDNYVYIRSGRDVLTRNAIYYNGITQIPIIGAVSANTALTIPEAAEQDLYITLQKTTAVIDLSKCRSKDILILAAYSRLNLILPDKAINQKIQVISRASPVEIDYLDETNVRIVDSTRSTNKNWIGFESMDVRNYEYKRVGFDFTAAAVSVEIDVAIPHLVLSKISSNNE